MVLVGNFDLAVQYFQLEIFDLDDRLIKDKEFVNFKNIEASVLRESLASQKLQSQARHAQGRLGQSQMGSIKQSH